VDPRRIAFDGNDKRLLADDMGLARVALSSVGHDENGHWFIQGADAMNVAFVERHGAWACGWRWARDDGSIGGGVVGAWCCESHSMKGATDEVIAHRAALGLREWRAWIELLDRLFQRLPPADDDVTGSLAFATTRVLDAVVARTGAGDAWYAHATQVLSWYLESWGASPQRARAAAGAATSGRFQSWCTPPIPVVTEIAAAVAERARDAIVVPPARDDLRRHLDARARTRWLSGDVPAHTGKHDGHRRYIAEVDALSHREDDKRAARMTRALDVARTYAAAGQLMSFELLRELHDLGVGDDDEIARLLRGDPAYAKGGRERYGFTADLVARLEACALEADDAGTPLLARACRLYLDVLFFHPFMDGNSRLARLAFDLVLARDGVILDDVRALFASPIPAGDVSAYEAFLRLASTVAARSAASALTTSNHPEEAT
jgi:hypothetical protein